MEPIGTTIIKRIQAPAWTSNNLVALNKKQHMDTDQIGLFAVLTNITLAHEEEKKVLVDIKVNLMCFTVPSTASKCTKLHSGQILVFQHFSALIQR